MAMILIFLLAGFGAGFLLRNRPRIIRAGETLAAYSVYAMLLILGISLGIRTEALSQIPRTGLIALVLSLASAAGSVLMVFAVYRFLIRRKKN